ncbi:hypothetical protein AAC387_Pa01g0526 [Persea americana]
MFAILGLSLPFNISGIISSHTIVPNLSSSDVQSGDSGLLSSSSKRPLNTSKEVLLPLVLQSGYCYQKHLDFIVLDLFSSGRSHFPLELLKWLWILYSLKW